MKAWHIPKLWPGATVAVLGGGQSMTPQAAALAARNNPTIGVNNSFRLARVSLVYAADAEWWAQNPDAVSYDGLKATVSHVSRVNHIRNLGVTGYSDETDGIHTFGNGGAQAVQIAAKAGAAKIVLLGFDMRGGHWHPEHKAPLRQTSPETYVKWIKRFDVLAQALRVRGVTVINCTPNSALKCFEFARLEDVLADVGAFAEN